MVMRHFLLVFNRPAGELITVREYAVRSEALQARFDAERIHRHDPSIEVVVLTAASEADLHRTHARYFEDVGEIARRGLTMVREAG